MTLNDYVLQVQQDVDDSSISALPLIQNYIIATYNDIMGAINQWVISSVTDEFTAVVGQTAYPASQDVNVVHQVAYKPVGATNYRILQQISLEDYKNDYINRPNSLPTVWFYDGDVINVAPRPSEAGTIREVYTPNVPAATLSTVSQIPDRYMRRIIDGAIYRFKFWENNVYASLYYQSWFQAELAGIVQDLSTKSKTLSPKLYGQK